MKGGLPVPQLILASVSPRRAELLRQLGRPFAVKPAKIREVTGGFLTPRECVLLNAIRKARSVARKYPSTLVIGADTEVCLGAKVFGKPRNRREAARMLTALQGRTHEVITAVCLIEAKARRQRVFTVRTLVTFRRLSQPAIAAYLRQIDPLDKAGAYAIQEHGASIVKRIEGSFSNVVGLPMEQLRSILSRWSKPSSS